MRHIFISMEYLTFAPVSDQRRWRGAPRGSLAWEAGNLRQNGHNESAAWHQQSQEQVLRLPLPVMGLLLLSLMVGAVLSAVEQPDPASVVTGVRLKDLCDIYGVRDNQLHGIGVVVGLGGTGDKSRATLRMLKQLLASKHLNVAETDLESKNVAMVAVTADLPAFARNGGRLYTQVSCLGDATSLKGGILLQTPLVAADERIYAVAQGSVSIGGFGAAGPNLVAPGADHKNVETVAILAAGALVEREVPVSLLYGDRLRLVLRESDFTTASRVAKALTETFGVGRVTAEDAAVVTLGFVAKPSENDLVETIAKLQQLRVEPDLRARVVINSRTGTVVAGHDVRISEVAVSHAGLSLRVMPMPDRRADPNQPGQVLDGVAWVDPITRIRSPLPPPGTRPTATPGTLNVLAGATVDDIANALNALGARPRDLVAIFEAIQRAGALHAELVVM